MRLYRRGTDGKIVGRSALTSSINFRVSPCTARQDALHSTPSVQTIARAAVRRAPDKNRLHRLESIEQLECGAWAFPKACSKCPRKRTNQPDRLNLSGENTCKLTRKRAQVEGTTDGCHHRTSAGRGGWLQSHRQQTPDVISWHPWVPPLCPT